MSTWLLSLQKPTGGCTVRLCSVLVSETGQNKDPQHRRKRGSTLRLLVPILRSVVCLENGISCKTAGVQKIMNEWSISSCRVKKKRDNKHVATIKYDSYVGIITLGKQNHLYCAQYSFTAKWSFRKNNHTNFEQCGLMMKKMFSALFWLNCWRCNQSIICTAIVWGNTTSWAFLLW